MPLGMALRPATITCVGPWQGEARWVNGHAVTRRVACKVLSLLLQVLYLHIVGLSASRQVHKGIDLLRESGHVGI